MEYMTAAILWIIGGIAFFILVLILILTTFLISFPKYDPFLKWMCRLLLGLLFIRVKVEGIENIDRRRTYLFFANHVNIFDVIVFSGYLPTLVRGVELESHFRWPLYGFALRRVGNIPISHRNPLSAVKSLDRAGKALESGTSIIILPEGHRTLDGKMRPFKRTPFQFALQAKVDIVPLALSGAFQVKRKGSWIIRPGTITLRIGVPITFSSLADYNSVQLRDIVRERISALIEAELFSVSY